MWQLLKRLKKIPLPVKISTRDLLTRVTKGWTFYAVIKASFFPQPNYAVASCTRSRMMYVLVDEDMRIMSCHLCHILKAPCEHKLWNHFLCSKFSHPFSASCLFLGLPCYGEYGKILYFMPESRRNELQMRDWIYFLVSIKSFLMIFEKLESFWSWFFGLWMSLCS